MANHGDYSPELGWFSAPLKGWVNDPRKIGQVQPAGDPEAHRAEYERLNDRSFKPNPQMEQLIKLRGSDKAEDRARFDQIVTGTTRMGLAGYEQTKAAAE